MRLSSTSVVWFDFRFLQSDSYHFKFLETPIGQLDLIVLFEDSNLLLTSRYYPSIASFILGLARLAAENYDSRFAVVRFAAEPR